MRLIVRPGHGPCFGCERCYITVEEDVAVAIEAMYAELKLRRGADSETPRTDEVLRAVHRRNLPEAQHERACAEALQQLAWDLERELAASKRKE